jgi:3-oxosteroid 1-dehydrogenase
MMIFTAAKTNGNSLPRQPRAMGALGPSKSRLIFGVELHPAGGSSVGLLADVRGQVIHQRRHPIAGLYASGNVAAATEHGIGYQAGFSLASSMTFSYLAVRHMIDAR